MLDPAPPNRARLAALIRGESPDFASPHNAGVAFFLSGNRPNSQRRARWEEQFVYVELLAWTQTEIAFDQWPVYSLGKRIV